MNNVTMAVGHDLEFDMVGIEDEFLDVNVTVAESLFRFVPRAVKRTDQARLVVRRAHAAAAAAGNGLDHHGIADLPCDLHRLFFTLHDAVAARDNRHAGFAG